MLKTFEEREHARELTAQRAAALRGAAELIVASDIDLPRFASLMRLAGGNDRLVRAVGRAAHERTVKIAGEMNLMRGKPDASVWAEACNAAVK